MPRRAILASTSGTTRPAAHTAARLTRRRPPLQCGNPRPPHPREPVIHALASLVRRLPPSCGPVRLVGVDGHAGSGKTTFTAQLAAALGDAPVLHLDDIASHDALFAWTGRLREQVIGPLGRGESARYAPYDWRAGNFGPPRVLAPAPVVLVEGVGAGRRALRPHLGLLLWMEVPREEAWRRGRERDGGEQGDFWAEWVEAEARHFAEDPSRPFANLLVRQQKRGFEVLQGPLRTPATDRLLTHGDDSHPMW